MGFNFRGTQFSAYFQIVLGFLSIVFGIFDRIFIYRENNWRTFHSEGVIAIWTGVWFLVTGIIGHYASKPQPHNQQPRAPLVSTYLGFSIVATVFAGVLLICFSVGLSYITGGKSCSEKAKSYECPGPYYYGQYYSHHSDCSKLVNKCRTSVGLGAMIIIFAIAEFAASIWASSCCCSNGCNCCGESPQQGQVVYLQTQGGPVAAYIMTQGPHGMPVAVPVMTGEVMQTQAVGGQAYMMQNPQAATVVTPPQYVQGGGQVQMVQNPQGATVVTPPQYVQGGGQVHVTQKPQGETAAIPLPQGVTTTSGEQQAGINTDVRSDPPPVYMP